MPKADNLIWGDYPLIFIIIFGNGAQTAHKAVAAKNKYAVRIASNNVFKPFVMVEHRGLELKSSHFITYHNFEKTPILRGLQAFKILRNIKIYSKFS